jgi:hypothetical protein
MKATTPSSPQPAPSPKPLANEFVAARELGVSVFFLRADRYSGRCLIPYVKVGRKLVRYDLDDVRAALLRYQQGGAPTAPTPPSEGQPGRPPGKRTVKDRERWQRLTGDAR